MPARYYRPLGTLAASLSLLLGACGWVHKSDSPSAAAPSPTVTQQASASPDDGMDTEATIWTILGLAKKPSQIQAEGTGRDVSPELWQAVHDTLSFVRIDSQDPMAGLIVTNWYSPPGKPDERMRITSFIKSRALRSDSIAVSIERQVRAAGGAWQPSTIAQRVVWDLENDILLRARQIHAARVAAHTQ